MLHNKSLEVQCLDKICSLYAYPEKPIENEIVIKNNLTSSLFEKLVSRQKFKYGHGETLFLKNNAFNIDQNDPLAFNLKVDLLNMKGAELTQQVKNHLKSNLIVVYGGTRIEDNLTLKIQDIGSLAQLKYIIKMGRW